MQPTVRPLCHAVGWAPDPWQGAAMWFTGVSASLMALSRSSLNPNQFCTFGSRLVSPGCYVFNRRLDRFCSALSSMLERHLSSHMWK